MTPDPKATLYREHFALLATLAATRDASIETLDAKLAGVEAEAKRVAEKLARTVSEIRERKERVEAEYRAAVAAQEHRTLETVCGMDGFDERAPDVAPVEPPPKKTRTLRSDRGTKRTPKPEPVNTPTDDPQE